MGQGLGPRATSQPPQFSGAQLREAAAFFNAEGYCVMSAALTSAELAQLNGWLDERSGEEVSLRRGGQGLGCWSGNVLLREDAAETLDHYLRLPTLTQLVDELWGAGNARFAQFDFRETPAGEGPGKMGFHHDATLGNRMTREPYGPADWLCSIVYLTDVDEHTPAFAVAPKTVTFEPIEAAKQGMPDAYVEVPLFGKAGTVVFYDTATYHTRLDSPNEGLSPVGARRTMHQYWARGGYLDIPPNPAATHANPRVQEHLRTQATTRPPTPLLTDWVRIPKRLAMSADPEERLFYSHWNPGQCEWAARDFEGDGALGGKVVEKKE